MQIRYYVFNSNNRWERVYRCGYDAFTFKGDNTIYHFDNFHFKSKVV